MPHNPKTPQKSFTWERMTWKVPDYPRVKDWPPPPSNPSVGDVPARVPGSPPNSSDAAAALPSTRESLLTRPFHRLPSPPQKAPPQALRLLLAS